VVLVLDVVRLWLRRRAALLAACLLVFVTVPVVTQAQARLVVGLGDQAAATFQKPAVQRLHFEVTRLDVAWNWNRDHWMVAQTDAWMASVRAAGLRPMVAFQRVWTHRGRRFLPPVSTYLRKFRAFRARYPYVREFSAWNEPNVPNEPMVDKPWMAARYYDAMAGACGRRCTVVGGDVADVGAMRPWVERYMRNLKHRPKVWAMHNYHDANEHTGSTARLLALVHGPLWVTETGGVKRRVGLKGQARAVARVFAIARSSRRIRRVYFYQWQPDRQHIWDSAFVGIGGARRPAYWALLRGLRGR
jgi:hypothetical protein